MKTQSISRALAFAAAFSLVACGQARRPVGPATPPATPRPFPDVVPEASDAEIKVVEGTEAAARVYYVKTAQSLGLVSGLQGDEAHHDEDFAKVQAQLTMQRVLDYAGFGDLKVPEALAQTPDELKKRFPPKALVSVRYFSPKISDVSGPPINPEGLRNVFSYGWRKIVRLQPQAGSEGARAGVRGVMVLFNVFTQPDENGRPTVGPKGDPFLDNDAANNQVIILGPKPATDPASRTSPPLFWFVFGSVQGGAPLQTFLNATFDARDPIIEQGTATPVRKYHVPDACADCHGGRDNSLNTTVKFVSGKLNYVDTDHIYDRVQAGDDFHPLTQTTFPVLLDGGKIAADGGPAKPSDRFKEVFKDFRVINSEIHDQNAEVTDTPQQAFALRAAAKWIEVHGLDPSAPVDGPAAEDYKSEFTRALGDVGADIWSEASEVDRQLLPQLNRLCYRCHSSLRYSVFDKAAVIDKIRNRRLIERMEPPPANPAGTPSMPQDRKLTEAQRTGVIALLRRLLAPP
jgi:hypothetical protein